MERLTYRDKKGEAHLHCYQMCADAHEDCNTAYEVDRCQRYVAFRKLADYEDAEEQGLLLRLPCKVGDNIYIIKPYGIEEASITGISEADDIDCFCFEIYIDPDCHEIIALEEFNDTWFLTKEEAKAKLKEMESIHE